MRSDRPVCSAARAVLRMWIFPASANDVVDSGHESCVPVSRVPVSGEDVRQCGPDVLEQKFGAGEVGGEDYGEGGVEEEMPLYYLCGDFEICWDGRSGYLRHIFLRVLEG
jgi:hypothetical protein